MISSRLGSPRWPSAGAAQPHFRSRLTGSRRTPCDGAAEPPSVILSEVEGSVSLVPKFHLGTPPAHRETMFRANICLPALAAVALAACSSAVTPAKMAQVKPAMKAAEVETILGRPARIEQSETADQTLNGEVDHYPAPNGEGRVIFVNHAVFKSEFVPGAKS